MRISSESGSIAGRMVMFGLIGLAIGGVLGFVFGGLIFGFGSAGMTLSLGVGAMIGLFAGVAMGWFRGIGDSSPREGPYDE